MIRASRFPAIPCPACGYMMDAASSPAGSAADPKDGDYNVCIECAEPSVYVIGALGVGLRKPTTGERSEIFAGHGHFIQNLIDYKKHHPPPKRRDT